MEYIVKYPEDGPKRIFYELKSEGYQIGETGIYNVLKRNQLTTKKQRQEYSRKNQIFKKYEPKDRDTREAFYEAVNSPAQIVVQKLDYIGKFETIGKIYQYTVLDLYSKWAAVKLYNQKREIDVWDYFEVKLVYLMKTFDIQIERLLTIKDKEFISYFIGGERYQDITKQFQFTHQYISADHRASESIDQFVANCTESFYNKISTTANMDSFAKVERAFQKFIRDYNFIEPIQEGANVGKVPAMIVLEKAKENQVDLDTLPLWMLALIHPIIKKEDSHEEEHKDQ